MKRIILLSITLLYLAITVFAQTPLSKQKHNVNAALDVLKTDRALRAAGVGFYAVDVKTGEVIAEYNPYLALKPASTMKLVTSATALDVLGKNFKFKTTIEYRGYIDTVTHILRGDIVVRGGGDPTLGSSNFSKNQEGFLYEWAERIKQAGIDSVNGYLIADASVFGYDMVPPTWSWEDMGNYFGAGACGLAVFDNAYTLTMNTGTKLGDTCKIVSMYPPIPEMVFENTVIGADVKDDWSYIFGQPYTYERFIRGKLPVGRAAYEISGAMPDPALYTVTRLAQVLNSQGIGFSQKPVTYREMPELKAADTLKHTKIYIHNSAPLSDIIRLFNFKSINLFGEHLCNYLGYKNSGIGTTKTGTDFVEHFWETKGVDIAGLSYNDGSGLSHYNTISAYQQAEVLKYMFNKSDFETYYKSIPTVGVEGTVKTLCQGTAAEGNMHAKSGSIRAVRAYAGYVKSASGRDIAFSIIFNNFSCSSSSAKDKMEPVLSALAEFKL